MLLKFFSNVIIAYMFSALLTAKCFHALSRTLSLSLSLSPILTKREREMFECKFVSFPFSLFDYVFYRLLLSRYVLLIVGHLSLSHSHPLSLLYTNVMHIIKCVLDGEM